MHVRLAVPVVLALAVTVAGLALPAADVAQATPGAARIVPVAPGVERHEFAFAKPNGAPVTAQVLTVRQSPAVRITTELSQGTVPGLETMQDMGRRLQPAGAVAVMNGGFWLSTPVGDPNSYFATDGRLVSESETQGSLERGTFAVTAGGQSILDRIDAQVTIHTESSASFGLTGVNRIGRTASDPNAGRDSENAIYAYTPDYGAQVILPGPDSPSYRGPATVLTMEGMTIAAAGAGTSGYTTRPQTIDGGAVPIIPNGIVLVGYGTGGDLLERLRTSPPEELYAVTDIDFPEGQRTTAWADAAEAVAAGPMIVRDGAMTPPHTWTAEGFSDAHNNTQSAPRSAIGVRVDGTTLMATIDGRQPDVSQGMSMAELAGFMLDLGAVDAIALDGGGSTQMVVDGVVRNRPCQAKDSCRPLRPVANGIVVYHDYGYPATDRLAGSGREATAAAVARASHPDGAGRVLLASAGDFPDALAGGPLAAAVDAPLLLTGATQLSAVTREAIADLGARSITILGGRNAVSPELEAALRDEGFAVDRIAGSGRLETAAGIARAMGTPHPRVFLASAGGFADALSAAAPAGILRAPVVLNGRDRLSPATRDAIASARPVEVVIVGGTGVIGPGVEADLRALNPGMAVTRLSGRDRFGTAKAINEWAQAAVPDLDMTGLVTARGDTFPDALAGGPLAAKRRQLLMIVPPHDVLSQTEAASYLQARGDGPLARVTLLGGYGVLSSFQQWQLDSLAS